MQAQFFLHCTSSRALPLPVLIDGKAPQQTNQNQNTTCDLTEGKLLMDEDIYRNACGDLSNEDQQGHGEGGNLRSGEIRKDDKEDPDDASEIGPGRDLPGGQGRNRQGLPTEEQGQHGTEQTQDVVVKRALKRAYSFGKLGVGHARNGSGYPGEER